MLKKGLKISLSLLLVFTLFSFWMSPRLGGIIPLGKDKIDSEIFQLSFDSVNSGNHELIYRDITQFEHLVRLRTTYQLDSIVKDCESDFEKIVKIQNWVSGRWIHDSNNAAEINDAVFILKAAEKGERFRCVEYSFVAGQCLASLGLKVRGIGLMAKDISEVKSGGGHALNEVYSKDLKKWVMIDPQYNVIPTYNGIPLNAIELQKCIAKNKDFDIINPSQTITKTEYKAWIGPYLYYFTTTLRGESLSIKDRILGIKKQLTLYPIGAEQPTYFQKIFRLNTSYYTHSLNDFYPVID